MKYTLALHFVHFALELLEPHLFDHLPDFGRHQRVQSAVRDENHTMSGRRHFESGFRVTLDLLFQIAHRAKPAGQLTLSLPVQSP